VTQLKTEIQGRAAVMYQQRGSEVGADHGETGSGDLESGAPGALAGLRRGAAV